MLFNKEKKKTRSKIWLRVSANRPSNNWAQANQDFLFQDFLFQDFLFHLHDGVILLLRPESFSFFFSYLNLVIPGRFKWQKS